MFATTTTSLDSTSLSSSSSTSYTGITRFPFPFPPSSRIEGASQLLRCSLSLFSFKGFLGAIFSSDRRSRGSKLSSEGESP